MRVSPRPSERRRRPAAAGRGAGAGLLSAALLALAVPAAAHESADHGTLSILDGDGRPAGALVDCAFSVLLSHPDGDGGFLRFPEAPVVIQPESWSWNASAEPDGPAIGLFAGFPPGDYRIGTSLRVDGDHSHGVPPIPLTIEGPCGPPGVACPTDVSATLQEDGSALVAWTEDSDSNGTTLWRNVNGQEDRAIAHLPAGTQSYVDATVYNGAIFNYSPRPHYDAYSQWCGSRRVITPEPRTYFPCPTDVAFTPMPDGLLLRWKNPEGAAGANVYRLEGGEGGEPVFLAKTWGESYVDGGLAEGEPATYTVRSVFHYISIHNETEAPECPSWTVEAGWEAPPSYPGDGSASPPTAPPSAPSAPGSRCPSGLQLDRQADGTVVLTWHKHPDSNHTNVYRSEGGGAFLHLASPAFETYHDLNATEEGAYTYRLTATFGNVTVDGCEEASIAAVPVFPTFAAAFLAVASAAAAYSWAMRRRA